MEDQKTKKVLVNVVLDRSGSMNTTRAGTISGYNEYINELRADKETEYTVTLIQFDAPAHSPELTATYSDRPLSDVVDLTEKDYEPRGMTPLYDAIGECIRRVDAKGRAIITVIITDGMENASIEFTRETVKGLITAKEKEGWTFAFLGANIDAYAVGASAGIKGQNVANYQVGNEQALYSNVAQATMRRSEHIRKHGMVGAVGMSFFEAPERAEIEKPVPPPARLKPELPSQTTKRPNWKITD